MKSGRVIVYALVEPNSGPLRYVGQTTNTLTTRLSQHISAARRGGKTYLHNWIRKLLKENLKPNIIVLDPDATLHISEQEWISKLSDAGFNLTNLSDGGDGNPGYTHSEETKNKISKALIGNKNGLNRQWTPDESFKQGCRERNMGEKNPNFGKPRPKSTRMKIRASQPNARPVICIDTGEVFPSIAEAKRQTGIDNIGLVCEGKRKKAGKLNWTFA